MPIKSITGSWKRHHFIEWGFIAALLAICVYLTTLQNRWTSSLGRETTRQQTTQVRAQAERLCNAFDDRINDSCSQLSPSGGQIETLGREGAHAQALRRWQLGHPLPLFRRLAVMVPEAGQAQLYLLDQITARLTKAAAWPPEWNVLYQNLSLRAGGRNPQPFVDPTGIVREYPIFGSRGAGRSGQPGEIEWMILELDLDYARRQWLPDLVREFLNPGKELLDEALVETNSSPPEVIFSTGSRQVPRQGNTVTLDFNSKSRGGQEGPDAEYDTFWTLYVWPGSGEFAAAVSRARKRDFAVACVLDVLLLAGGLLIIRYAHRARRLGDARLKFVTAVSHELRTPLTVILTAAENLDGVVHDPDRHGKYAGLIVEHTKQLAEMVEQVLAFAGARRNESVLVRKPVVVAQVLRDAIAACAPETQAAHCEVETHVDPNLPPVLGDTLALQRVFQNLLSNAARHGGDGSWIGVNTKHLRDTHPGYVEVEVCDHGPGIPVGEQAHVFEPFFRGSRADALRVRGSGIGLSVVQEIVQFHHGNVRVESRPGQGTTFTVRLPVAEEASEVLA